MKTVIFHHAYAPDGVPDHKGHDRCALCGLPKERDVHELPITGDDVRNMEARRIGETREEASYGSQ